MAFFILLQIIADKIRGNVGTVLVIIDSIVIIVVFHYCVNSGLWCWYRIACLITFTYSLSRIARSEVSGYKP